jgi:hypothetical protein
VNGGRAPPVTPLAGTLYILGDKIMTPFVGGLSWMPMAVFAAQICPASVRFAPDYLGRSNRSRAACAQSIALSATKLVL